MSSKNTRLLERSPYEGKLHCSTHNFITEDPDAFEDHLVKETHYEMGVRNCVHCNKPVNISLSENKHTTAQVRRGNIFHDKCKEAFVKNV